MNEAKTPLKASYKDENELIDEYCKAVGCSICNGTDMNGEPNGYGCDGMNEWVADYADLIDYGEE